MTNKELVSKATWHCTDNYT